MPELSHKKIPTWLKALIIIVAIIVVLGVIATIGVILLNGVSSNKGIKNPIEQKVELPTEIISHLYRTYTF